MASVERELAVQESGQVFVETADIEASTDAYARRFAGPTGAWLLQVQQQATLRLLQPYRGARVLDVGGGHGQLAAPLVGAGYDVTVIGSDQSCQSQIQHLVRQRLCAFEIGNIIDLPYPDRSFDVVISFRLLAHVTQWQRYLRELARVARSTVIIDYPSTSSVNCVAPWLFQYKLRLEGNTRTFTTYNDAEVLHVFRSAGFGRSHQYRQFFLPMVIHRVLKRPSLSAAIENAFRKVGLTDRYGSPVILRLTR